MEKDAKINKDGTAKSDPVKLLEKEIEDIKKVNIEIATFNDELNDQIIKQAENIKEKDEEIFNLNGFIKDLKEEEEKIAIAKAKDIGKVKTYKIIAEAGAQYRDSGQVKFAHHNETVTTAYPFHKSVAKEMRIRQPEEIDLPS